AHLAADSEAARPVRVPGGEERSVCLSVWAAKVRPGVPGLLQRRHGNNLRWAARFSVGGKNCGGNSYPRRTDTHPGAGPPAPGPTRERRLVVSYRLGCVPWRVLPRFVTAPAQSRAPESSC